MELYLVAVETQSGKDRLEPVWVRSTSGAQLQRKEDIKEAMAAVKKRQLTPTGSIYTAKSLVATLEDVKDQLRGTEPHFKYIFNHLVSSDEAEEYMSSEQGHKRKNSLARRFERITEQVCTYIDEVLPTNTKASLAQVLETSIPTIHRLMGTLDVHSRRGISWSLMARMLDEMGVLEDLEDALERRVKSLKKDKADYLRKLDIVEQDPKGRMYISGGRG